MFKKLVEKASVKKPAGNSDGLKASDLDVRLVFHYGVPSNGTKLAYDNNQKILALSTKDGRIKLFGKNNTQAILQSPEPVPSKFLQFIQNQGILVNVTFNNYIEVWDLDKKLLADEYVVKGEITSFAVIQHSFYMYIGDSVGNISVFNLDQEPWHIVNMKYIIPLSASYGILTEVPDDTAVTHILPQLAAESKRVLIIFRNGQIILWDIQESKSIFRTGGNISQPSYNETKKATSACWACPFGSKVVVGYSNGELLIWNVPSQNVGNDLASDYATQNTPMFKLNLGYKSDKIPIGSVKWIYGEGKASRLYVIGASDIASPNLVQVVLLNEKTESRTIKLGLHLAECCIDMEVLSTSSEQSKHKQDSLVLLGKSGRVYAYDDSSIERYLLQCQSKSSPSLPREVMIKLPLADSSITAAKFISDNPNLRNPDDEEYVQLLRNYPPLMPVETKHKDGAILNSSNFTGFSKVKNLYITGHSDGAITFWDASCPFFIPILQLKQQSEHEFSTRGIPITALYFDTNSPLLVSGDQSGMVCIFRFKPEPYSSNSFISLTGSTKKAADHIIHSVKLVKTNGAVLSMNIDHGSKHLAVGSDQGCVSVIDMNGSTLLYQKQITSGISTGIISLHFRTCSLQGFKKNILAVGTKDSSVLAFDSETGKKLSSDAVHPKKPSRALLMQVLDGQGELTKGLGTSEVNDIEDATTKQSSILLCSEKALYVYSLVHVVQGVKKVLHKKKFHSSSCCWASTFYSHSDIGLVLLFTNGKAELRSLPELSLILETSIRDFIYSPSKLKSFSDRQMCCSSEGDLVMVNGDQEILVASMIAQRDVFRLLDSVSCVYIKERKQQYEEAVPAPVIIHKEKKKGIFSSVIKDFTGSKEKHLTLMELEDTKESMRQLSVIFSNANFPSDADNNENLTMDEDELELNIDDIDLGDPRERRKDQRILGTLNKTNLTGKFQALKGRLKDMKGNIQKTSDKEEQQDEKGGAVDQIKKKYGFSSSSDETSTAKLAQNKLQENMRKLQGINLRATEMQDTARSFSSLAKQVLRTAEQDKR
ncbi:uncharacterized protein LOC129284382 [Prosopis cineraria]|uniref:uncharacterized protein LOC129284382 n=1 Tax=Prosopis cineraria TaxID=364024 RepID=UPI00240FD2A7|nr:uncharacterized protein LOC129284382 [Prosopis cineraria]